MKNVFYFASLLLVMSPFAVFAQDENEKPISQVEAKEDKPSALEGKTHQFGLTIKRMNYTYIPEEYNVTKDYSWYSLRSSGPLKGNEQVTLPFAFSYYNKNWNLFVEASHYKAVYNDMHNRRTDVINYYDGNEIRNTDVNYSTKTRRESKINFYKQSQLNDTHSIYYGLGIRNIFKESYEKYSDNLSYEFRDSLNANGLQFFLKYQLSLTSALKLNLTFEPYLTSGTRNRQEGFPNQYSYFYFIFNSSPFQNGKGNSIYGAETDLQLAYNINENLNLLVGYNYIYSKVRNGSLDSLFSNSRYVVETSDHIYGYYIGLNAKF